MATLRSAGVPIFINEDSRYIVDERIFLTLTYQLPRKDTVSRLQNALQEFKRVFFADTPAAAVWEAVREPQACHEIAVLVGSNISTLFTFNLLAFILGLFLVCDGENCSCRDYKHYHHCVHSPAFRILKGEEIPKPEWVSGPIRVVVYGRRRKFPKV